MFLYYFIEESDSSADFLTDSESEVPAKDEISKNYSYIIVGDNLDKSIKPRHMTFDHQTQSIHYFHYYAVQDRINISHLSNDRPVSKLPISTFLMNLKVY